MVTDPVTIHKDSKLKHALTIMQKEKVSHLIVIDDNMQLAGVISKSDILKYLLEVLARTTGKTYTSLELNNIDVSIVMSSNPVHSEENALQSSIAKLLVDNKINCIPIVDKNGTVKGIVTHYDIMRLYVS